ncbi:MAG: response regulator transcription factor [Sphingobacteriaceae bacterium]|nr:response regulator transcription factor [Sphingobacteriaceae bacterium]
MLNLNIESLKKTLHILIIDDHQLVRDGIKTMLFSKADEYDFLITEADAGEKGIQKVLESDFDIVLADYQLPDLIGPDMVSRILLHKPKQKILALSGYDEYACIKNMMNAGAKGYVLKNISPDELIRAIETILSGRKYYASDVKQKVELFRKKKNVGSRQQLKLGVSAREMQILNLIAKGLTNDEISKKLKLAKRTVDTHRQNLLVKFNVSNTAILISKATELAML